MLERGGRLRNYDFSDLTDTVYSVSSRPGRGLNEELTLSENSLIKPVSGGAREHV